MVNIAHSLSEVFSGVNAKIQRVRILYKFKTAGLCTYDTAWRTIYPEFEKIIGHSDWHEPILGKEVEFRETVQKIVKIFWSDDSSVEELSGSTAAILNFVILYLVCHQDIDVTRDSFISALSYSVEEASVSDIWNAFEEYLWSENKSKQNLSTLIPNYLDRHFPGENVDWQMSVVKKKLSDRHGMLENMKMGKMPILFVEGLNNSTLDKGSGPNANLARYVEYYAPDLSKKIFLMGIYNLENNIRIIKNSLDEHWIFTPSGIVIVTSKNLQHKPRWIPRKEIEYIAFGNASFAVFQDGNKEGESFKIYMFIQFTNGISELKYQSIAFDKSSAVRKVHDFQNSLSLIEDYYEASWSDEKIEDYDAFQTQQTTTYYWTSG